MPGQRSVNPFHRFCHVYPFLCELLPPSQISVLSRGPEARPFQLHPASFLTPAQTSICQLGPWDSERESELLTVTQRIKSLGKDWEPGLLPLSLRPFHCQTCVLWSPCLQPGFPEDAMTSDPAKPVSTPSAPLGPPNSGLRACGG